ncbi:MAG: Ig-like domain-containing protein [Burkholderiales bacterium]|nr:Ig-like domain-containing protein [Burkholderiales bacterium]
MNIVTKIKNLYARKALSKITLAILAGSSLISLVSCSDGGNAVIDNNTNVSNELFIENAGPIPVLDGKSTATGIYVRNTSDKDISGINYIVENTANNQNNSSSLSLSQDSCKTIAAHSSCLLAITTPDLSLGGSGSNLLVANYNDKQDKQLVNYTYIDSKHYSGVNFSDGSQTIYGGNSYATAYVFVGNGQSHNDIGFNSSNDSVVVSNGLTNGKLNLAANQVVALELSSNPNFTSRQVTITPYKVTSSKNLSQNLQLGTEVNGSLQVTITPTQQANLLMGTLPILTQAESSTVLTIINNGNQNATTMSLVSSSADITVSPASENPCGSSLIAGGSCNYQISLNNNYNNGSALLTLGYNNGLSATSTVQTVYYQNNKSEPMVKLVPTQSQYTAHTDGLSGNVTFNVTNFGNAQLDSEQVTIYTSLQHTGVTIQNNNCPSVLAAHTTCQIEVSILPDAALADHGNVYLNMTGSFTGEIKKSYSFMSLPVYVNITDTTAPELVSTTPSNTEESVSLSTGVTLNFSEPMDPTTLNGTNIWLQKNGAGENTGIVLLNFLSVTNNNKSVTFVMPGGTYLDSLSSYKIVINPSAILDASGNAIGQSTAENVTKFTTAYDATPTIVGFTPNNGATNVNQAPSMTITFSEAMVKSGINASNIMLKDQSGNAISGYTVDYRESTLTAIMFLDNGVVLSDESTYGIYVNQQNLKDLVNKPIGSNSNYLVTKFTTGDYTKPELINMATIPANGSSAVNKFTEVSLTFTKKMERSTLNTSTIKLIRKSNQEQIVLNSPSFSNDDKVVTLQPTQSLLNTESYIIEINPSEITDASINHNKLGNDNSRVVSQFTVLPQWTWINGSKYTNPEPIYGTQGVSAKGNTPGGRQFSSSWTDSLGNVWLFGGENSSGAVYNNLWKYNPTTNQWTWVSGANVTNSYGTYGTKGTPNIANIPGGRRGAQSWVDSSGNLWIFGGYGYGVSGGMGYLNDLWKYNPSTNQWTWVSGGNIVNNLGVYGTKGVGNVSNIPGARWVSAGWIDNSGNFWLYGGNGNSSSANGYLNDLWKYNPNTNEWTWMSGSNLVDSTGVYGTKGIANAANFPPGREMPTDWVDNSGNLWLFGGWGYGKNGSTKMLMCDLWKYNPNTNEWTWVSGRDVGDVNGVYGTQNQASVNNYPGSRRASIPHGWKDNSGNLWLYGGDGYYGSTTNYGRLSDLWKYNPNTNEWTWVSGMNQINSTGVYGTQGVSNMNDRPGARDAMAGWFDSSGRLWLYGGRGYGANSFGALGDLWIYSL